MSCPVRMRDNAMNCRDYREWLQRELDGEASAVDADRAGHLATCADCRQLQAASSRLQMGLRLRSAPTVPADLTSRIVVGVLADRRRRQNRRRLVAGALALAASILVAVWASSAWDRPSGDNRVAVEEPPAEPDFISNMLAATQELSVRTVATLPRIPDVESIQSTVSDATTAVGDLTSQTVDATVARTKALLPTIEGPLLPPMADASPLEPATASLVETGQSMTAGFEPVTNSAKRAFSMFRRDLPSLPGL